MRCDTPGVTHGLTAHSLGSTLDSAVDAARHAANVTLSDSDKTASNAKSQWANVMGDEYLSSGVYEVHIACDSVDNLSLFFGVAAPGFWEEVMEAEADEEEMQN